KEIISQVGREKLMQWLMMIIYSRSSKNISTAKSHYSIMIQNRIDTMLGVLAKLKMHESEKLQEQARLVAMLSLLENVFDVNLETTLKAFDLELAVQEALLNHKGVLGKLFAIAIAIEEGNYATMQKLLEELGLKVEDIEDTLNKSLDAAKQ
ncbi:MAG: hypothetical protein MUP09_06335, partial [Thiovulaceae bacterium]|nr:hypothetical protein [Sulfurimonadaceae bacterium]